jgi:glycolate oxidase FAD binding subunit
VDELVALVSAAAESRQAIVSEGSGTKRHFGPAAVDGAMRMTVRGLDKITSYDPDEMVISAQAGARLCDVQRTLAEHGQWLAVDPPFADATLGGIVSTHSSGPRRLAYGTIKDLLVGVRVVGARGQLTKSGGRVVKNVSGYDLHRLQVGAFGSLGVLVEAHLRVAARPETAAILALSFSNLERAHRTLLDVHASPLRPTALEALDALAAKTLGTLVPDLPTSGALGLIGIEGTQRIVDRHLRDLESLQESATDAVFVKAPATDRVWDALRDLPELRRDQVTVRIATRPHDLPSLLAGIEPQNLQPMGTVVHVGLGIARIGLSAAAELRSLAPPLLNWARLARSRSGYCVVESAPLDRPGRETLPWSSGAERLDTAIRSAWDPDRILNPGRVA